MLYRTGCTRWWAKMGQVDSEAYPPLKALRGALKDAPGYITAISSKLQDW